MLEVEKRTFHVVIAFREDKQEYCAHLVYPTGADSFVLASIESHGSHPGWHLHVNCDGAGGGGNVGRIRYQAQKRLPHAKSPHRDRRIPVTQAAALEPVIVFFRIDMLGGTADGNGSLSLWQ